MGRWRALVVLVLLVLARAQGARAQSEYDRLIAEAVQKQSDQAYVEAHALFVQAHSLEPSARTLRGMGVASFQAGRYAEAVSELGASLVDPRKPLDAELAAKVLALLERARPHVAIVQLVLAPADAEVRLDGWLTAERGLVLAPGSYTLGVRASGHVERSIPLTVLAGSEQTLELVLLPAPGAEPVASAAPRDEVQPAPSADLPPAPPAATRVDDARIWKRTGFVLLGGAAAAALGAGASFLTGKLRMDAIADSCRERPAGHCTQAEKEAELAHAGMTRLETTSTALLAVSVGLSAAAVTLLTWRTVEGRKTRELGLSGSSLTLRGSF